MRKYSSMLAGVVIIGTLCAFALMPKDRIKEVKNIKTGASATYTYAADGRVLTVKSSNGVVSKYEYKGTLIFRQTDDPRTKTSSVDTFYLNEKGFVRELRIGAHLSVNNSTQQFQYDQDGFQIEWKTLHNAQVMNTIRTVYRDSNAISMRQNFSGDARDGRGTSTYYTDKRNTIGNENMGTGYLGLGSRQLARDQEYIWTMGDTSHTHYNYHFDSQGRVSIKVSYFNGRPGDSTAYTYY